MAFNDAITTIVADLTQNVAPAMGITLPITSRLGAQWRNNRVDAPPYLVWVPTDEDPGPLRNLGQNPRQLMTRRIHFDVYLYATPASADDQVDVDLVSPVDTLLSALLCALYRTSYGEYVQEGARWYSQNGTVNFFQAGVIQSLALDIPVTDLPWGTATPTSAGLTLNPNS